MTPPMAERYLIGETLGAGGMGVVYRATDMQLQRTVALKALDHTLLTEDARALLVREARAASALNHPSICTIYEVTDIDGRPCIVMEHVDGTSLAAAIPPEGFPPELVGRYGIQIADALAHAHGRGLIHRDLKSANVMITRDGRAKVLDFGIACSVRERQRGVATEVTGASKEADAISGTLPYMSPHVLEGNAPSTADDVWSLGVLLYEMATGDLPFRGTTRFQLATAIQRDAPAALPARVPPGLRAVILRCLARTSGARYQHAHEVRAALEVLQPDIQQTAARPILRNGAAAVLVLLIAAFVTSFGWSRRPATPPARESASAGPPARIAVLPFANPGRDPQVEYLTDGLAETVISSLARVPGKLTVTAWTTVQRYRDAEVDPNKVGQELGVRAVLLGSVVRAKDGLLVTVELVNATHRSRLWGETYNVKVADLLAVQRQIATRISAALQVQLSSEEQHAMQSPYPANSEAYHLYLQGQYHLYRFTPADYRRSLDFFQQAVQRDGRYALAHAGIARALSSLTYEGVLPPATYTEVERAAAAALALDPTLGAAHDALAQVKFAYEWNWDAAEREFQRAIALSPRDGAISVYYAIFLRGQRRWDEAIAQLKLALALNPVSVETSKVLGTAYFWAGRHDQAIEQFVRALSLDPTHAQTLDLLADVYAAKALYTKALDARRRYLETEGAFEAARALGNDGSEAGYRTAMRELYRRYLTRLEEDAKNASTYISPMEFAFTYIAVGETDRAFAALEDAYSQRAPWLSSLAADPAFDPVRADPRFSRLAARVGVPTGRP